MTEWIRDCPKCNKPIYYKTKRGKKICELRNSMCRNCCKNTSGLSKEEYRKQWREKNIEHCTKRDKNNRLLRMYGITLEQYNTMLLSQNNKCAICIQPFKQDDINIDHNHITGAIRQLLCHKCNAAIGLMDESIEHLQNAINYIKRWNN